MCRCDVEPAAESPLAALLLDCVAALAVEAEVDPRDVVIGPVDFGGSS